MSTYIRDTKNKGMIVLPKNHSLNIRSGMSTKTRILKNVKTGNVAGIATEHMYRVDGYFWRKIKFGNAYGYVRTDVITLQQPLVADRKDLESKKRQIQIVQKLVENDIEVYKRILVNKDMLSKAKKNGVDTRNQERVLNALITRYKKRQAALRNSNAIKTKNYVDSKYNNLNQQAGFNMVPIAVGAVVGIGITITAYLVFKPKYSESQQDLKITGEFKKFFDALPDDKKEAVKNDLEIQIDDAYNQGATDGTFGGMLKIVKPIALFTAGAILIPKLINSFQKNTQPKTAK